MSKGPRIAEGDRVSWRSHGSTAIGTVKRKLIKRERAAGRMVNASEEEPQYEVQSEKSGGRAVHKPAALRRTAKKKGG